MNHDNDPIGGFFCPGKILTESEARGESRGKQGKSGVAGPETGYFDWLAAHYDRLGTILDSARFLAHSVVLDILNVLDPPPQRILDLGCGTGLLAQQVLELLPDAHVYGVDCSLVMLEAARVNLADFIGRYTLAKADFRDPWEDVIETPLDAVIHYSALHHLPHHSLREVYTRLFDVLRPGGWFLHGDVIEERLPEAVGQVGRAIRRFQMECARADLGDDGELLDELEEVRRANQEKGLISELPAMPEQQVAWLLESGFEFAVRVFQDWQISLFLARKPE